MPKTKNCMGSAWAFNFVLDSSCCSSYSMKESNVITQSSVRSQYFLFQQYSSSFSICMVHIYLPRSIQWIGLLYEWNYRRYWPGFNKNVSGTDYYTSYSDNIERSCPFSTTALVPEQSIYNTTYTYDFYDVGTYLDCSVGCYFGVVGSSKPIYWSATTQVTIPKL